MSQMAISAGLSLTLIAPKVVCSRYRRCL